jgi:hypothetical protein
MAVASAINRLELDFIKQPPSYKLKHDRPCWPLTPRPLESCEANGIQALPWRKASKMRRVCGLRFFLGWIERFLNGFPCQYV